MKKLFVLSATLFAFGTFAVNAQNAPATPAAAAVAQEPVKAAEIAISKAEDLPEGVRKTLASDEFKNLQFSSATLVKEEKREYYNVVLKEGEKTVSVKLNADGTKSN